MIINGPEPMGWSLPDRLLLIRWGPGVLVSLVFSISGEREGVKPGTPPRIERYGSVPPRGETPPGLLQLSRFHYLLPRTCSRHILAGVTAAGFLMVKKMLDEYCGGRRVGKQEETVRIHNSKTLACAHFSSWQYTGRTAHKPDSRQVFFCKKLLGRFF